MYKSAIKTYLITLLVLIAGFYAIIFVSDPYMLFHKHWFHQNKMYNNMRIQNYGLIKFGKFDGIIIGTSMLENTSADEATKKFNNVRFANLSVSGGSYYERFKILNMALKTKKIKHVIMSFDYNFSRSGKINTTFEPSLYSWNSIIGKAKIYSTNKALRCIFLNKQCDFIKFDINHPKAWYAKKIHNRRFGGFDNWIKFCKDDQIKDAFEQLKSENNDYSVMMAYYKEVINKEIIPLLQHEKTTFSIIIPPYSMLWWGKRKASLSELFEPYVYLIQKTAAYKNVKIYWFYDENYVSDITKYKDLTHYHHSINSLQLDAIKNGTNIINSNNYQEKFTSFRDKINNFDIQSYIDKITNF